MGSFDPVALAGERRAHLGELHQHRRRALGVGPRVEEHGRPRPSGIGDRRGDGRPDTLGVGPSAAGPSHGGAGVAGRHHGHGPAVPDRLGRPHQRRVLLPADTVPGVVVHADDLAGRNPGQVPDVAHLDRAAHQGHLDGGPLGNLAGPGHDLPGCPVATHGIHHHRKRGELLTLRACAAPGHYSTSMA